MDESDSKPENCVNTKGASHRLSFPVKGPGRPATTGIMIKIDNLSPEHPVRVEHDTIREALREYVGKLTPVAEILIQRIASQAILTSIYESNLLPLFKEKGTITINPIYLPMVNSLRLNLMALQKLADIAVAPPDLDGYLEGLKRAKPGPKPSGKPWADDERTVLRRAGLPLSNRKPKVSEE